MTGYAQINGRSEITHGQKIEYDLYYVCNRTFLLDIKILLATVKLVIMGKGAFRMEKQTSQKGDLTGHA